MYLLALYTGGIFEAKFEKGFTMRDTMEYLLQRMGTNQEIGILIWAIIFVIIGYALIYPIGQASVIHYLNDQNQSISKALGKGTTKFFPMFEFNAFSTSFGMMSFVLILLRMIAMDIVSNILAQILLIIFFICVFAASILWPYTRYYIVLEGEGVYDAIKRSINTSIKHMGTTIKCALLEMILLLRFLINIIIILGVPFLLVYGAITFNIVENQRVWAIITIAIAVLVILTTYINAIIEAFFASYRYLVFQELHDK